MATPHSVAAAGASLLHAWAEEARRLYGRVPVPIILNIAALLLLTSGMARWSWYVLQPPVAVLPELASSLPPAQDRVDLQALQAAHLFGQAVHSAPASQMSVAQIPATALNLVLTGVVAAGPDSLALIRVNEEPETPFAVGEEITRGVTLRAVHADRAIIQRRGQTEALLLEDNAVPGEAAAARPASPPQDSASIQAGKGENTFTVDRDYAVNQVTNPEFLRQALIVPNAGGGFLVRQITPGSVYEQLGLKVGDVIRKVNGRTLNNMEDALRLYQQLGGVEKVGDVQLEVLRGGRFEQLHYTVQ